MKYKIIEVPDRKVMNGKHYIVEVTTCNEILFLKKSFKLLNDSKNYSDSLTTKTVYELALEYSTFDTIDSAKKALETFVTENPIYAEGKRIVEEGTI